MGSVKTKLVTNVNIIAKFISVFTLYDLLQKMSKICKFVKNYAPKTKCLTINKRDEKLNPQVQLNGIRAHIHCLEISSMCRLHFK